jgi:hypothetical protein
MPPKPNQWDVVVYDENRTFSIVDLGQVAALKEVRPGKANPKGPCAK